MPYTATVAHVVFPWKIRFFQNFENILYLHGWSKISFPKNTALDAQTGHNLHPCTAGSQARAVLDQDCWFMLAGPIERLIARLIGDRHQFEVAFFNLCVVVASVLGCVKICVKSRVQ